MGYRWYYFPAQKHIAARPGFSEVPAVEAFCSLQIPSTWQQRHGATQVDHPAPGDSIDADIPHYHVDTDYVAALSAKCVERDPEHPLQLWKCHDGGYCYGDIQGDHFETIPLALVVHALKTFGIPLP